MKNDENILSKNIATTNFPLIRREKRMDHFDERPLSLYDNLLITTNTNNSNNNNNNIIITNNTALTTTTTATTTTTTATTPSTMNSAAIRTISHHNPNHEQHHHHQQYYNQKHHHHHHHHHQHQQQPHQINDNNSIAQLNQSSTLARQPPAETVVALTKLTTSTIQNQHSNSENEFPFQDISFKFDDLPPQQQQTHNLLNNYDQNSNTNNETTTTIVANSHNLNNNNNNNDINNKNKYNNHESHNNSQGYTNSNDDSQLIITGNHIYTNNNNNSNNNSAPVVGIVPTISAAAATTTATIENYNKNNNVDTNTNVITITTNKKPTTTTPAMTNLYETTTLPTPPLPLQSKLVQYENVSETVKLRNSNRHQILNKPVISDAKSSFFGLAQTSQTSQHISLPSSPSSPQQSHLSNQIITSTPKHSKIMIFNSDRSPLINGAATNHQHQHLSNNNNNNNNNGDETTTTTTNMNQIKSNVVEYQNIPSNSACYGNYLGGGQSPPEINVIPSSPRRYSHHSEWNPLDTDDMMTTSISSPINCGASCSKNNYLPSNSSSSGGGCNSGGDDATTFDHRNQLDCCDSSGNGGLYGGSNTSRIGNDSSGTPTNTFFMEASRRLNETQPSQAVYLTTTVPQNIKGSNIAGRHTPTRTSLRHSRMIVVNKHFQDHQKPNPLEIKFPTAAKLLLIFQLMVGFCIASLALWILLWAPNTRTRDNPYWSGLSLLLAGILGLILIEFKRIPRQKLREHCFTFMRLNSMTFSVLATVVSFMACLFAALHLDNITSSTATCMSANMFTSNAACICLFGAANSTDQLEIKTVEEGKITAGGSEFHYRDLSCSEVTGAWKYILIASTALNLLGFAISFIYLLLLCLPAKSKRQRRRKTSYSAVRSRL